MGCVLQFVNNVARMYIISASYNETGTFLDNI